MKELKITKCDECPFAYREYDDYALGDDTFIQCSLSQFYNKREYIIDSYKLINQDDRNNDVFEKKEIPNWCLLRKEEYKLSLDGNIGIDSSDQEEKKYL